jgi:hypothetical protein
VHLVLCEIEGSGRIISLSNCTWCSIKKHEKALKSKLHGLHKQIFLNPRNVIFWRSAYGVWFYRDNCFQILRFSGCDSIEVNLDGRLWGLIPKGRFRPGLGSGAASPNRWILVDFKQDVLPSEPERCLPPLVVGGAQAPMRERAAKAKG